MRVAMAATIRPRPDRPSVGGRALDDALINKLTWKVPNALELVGSQVRARYPSDAEEVAVATVPSRPPEISVEAVEALTWIPVAVGGSTLRLAEGIMRRATCAEAVQS